MRNIFITLIELLCAMQSIVAQDVLITTDGDVMTVYIDDIGSSTIYYKAVNSDNTQLQRIDKSKIYMIKKADGTKIDFSGASTPTQPATTHAAQPMNTELSEEAKQRNRELIIAANNAASLPEHEKPKDKIADSFFATIGVEDNSIMCNDDIELSFETKDNLIILIVSNKSDRPIFIDQANTFFIRCGESSPYYVPTAYSSSTSKTGDANAGTFAGAMGIHDYQTNVSTSTVYSQRVVSIPPKSQMRLDSKWLFPTRDLLCCPGVYNRWYKYGKTYYSKTHFRFTDNKKSPDALKIGETVNYSQENSPLKFTFYVTYSFKEDCETINSISLNLFMKKIVGYYYYSPSEIQNYDSTEYFTGMIQFNDNHLLVGATYKYYDFKGTVLKRP